MPDIQTIAIVDDHTMLRKGLRTLIELFPGYKVLFDVGNGEEFIREVERDGRVPDIVLLDIAMPKMDGYETARWIKHHHPDCAVIALTTMQNDAAIVRMIINGARGYLLKDAEVDELREAFEQIRLQGFYYNEFVSRKILGSVAAVVRGDATQQTLVKLTDRELDFIRRACSEKTYKEIANDMCLSERTIDGYRESLFFKLNVSTRVGLVLYALRNGLVQL